MILAYTLLDYSRYHCAGIPFVGSVEETAACMQIPERNPNIPTAQSILTSTSGSVSIIT